MKKIFSLLVIVNTFLILFVGFSCNAFSVKNETEFTVAMALDNNFTLPTIVTMTSILENTKSTTRIDFELLISGDFLPSNKQKIMSLMHRYNCKINLIDMGKSYLHNRVDGHIPTATYYRLKLPSILINKDKCLYIDGDTIIKKDLSDIYNWEMDDYYIAGVKDWAICAKGKDYADFLGIKTMDDYVNAGVLVINLQKMRKDKLEQKFEDFMPIINNATKRQVHHDQDILNAVCFGKIKHLPLKYNAMTGKTVFSLKHYNSNPIIRKCYTKEEWREAGNNPVIIHYTWKKPWNILNRKFADQWWYYADKSGFIKEIKEKYQPEYVGIPFCN